jgi:anti-sigma factor ChrR (cupin superfamily)
MEGGNDLLIDTEAVPWKPLADGIAFKLLHADQASGAYAVLYKFAAGARLPRHKHFAPAEYYVLRGRMEYRAGVAVAGAWGLEPTGAVHDSTLFHEETVLLYRAYGALGQIDADGNVLRIVDAAGHAARWAEGS